MGVGLPSITLPRSISVLLFGPSSSRHSAWVLAQTPSNDSDARKNVCGVSAKTKSAPNTPRPIVVAFRMYQSPTRTLWYFLKGSKMPALSRKAAPMPTLIRRLRSMGIRDRPTSPRSPWHRAPFSALDTFFAVRSWVDCTTSMSGFDLRQAQPGAIDGARDRRIFL